MKNLGGILALIVVLAAGVARSQEEESNVFAEPQAAESPSTSSPEPTAPATRYYARDRGHYEQPKSTQRFSRAEFEANERTRRLEAMRWYGVSNARPVVSPTPIFGTYSPAWVSGGVDPFRWQDPNLTPNYYYNGNYYGRPIPPRYYLLGY